MTALGAILCIVVGAVVFALAIVTHVHGVTLLGLALIGLGLILACQPDSTRERSQGPAH